MQVPLLPDSKDVFFQDVCIDGFTVHVGGKKEISHICKTADDIKKCLADIGDGEAFFLGGLSVHQAKERASDEDVMKKNYFYMDWDVRKTHPDYTDKEIKDLAAFVDMCMDGFRYIVFSGNGLHIYFMGDSAIEVQNKIHWKLGLLKFTEEMQKLIGEELDRSCINLSRLARLPDSYNMKAEPKKVEIILFKDRKIDLNKIVEDGKKRETEMEEDNRKRAETAEREFPDAQDAYHAIEMIPVSEIMVKIKGWTFDGRNFYSPGNDKPKACFVSQNKNILVHGGTDHLDATKIAYGPFELVKALLKTDNRGVFDWFRQFYPQIQGITAPRRAEPPAFSPSSHEVRSEHTIGNVFTELQQQKFEQLLMGEKYWQFDKQKFLIRGAITRIGGFSNIGKSKIAYFLTYRLLHAGYKGMIFSTEVPRAIVLANLLNTHTGEKFWDIMDKIYTPPQHVQDFFTRLKIFDVVHTDNSLAKMEALIEAEGKAGHKPDFVVIDFVQAVSPKGRSDGEYDNMSKYALEVQAMAQRHNIAVVDLSQISNDGLRDEFVSAGHIPFKGSGHLYSSADIGILLKRDKRDPSPNPLMTFDIRKHKYLSPSTMELECDFTRGTFSVFA